jgi:hypothetical protein
MVFSSRQGENRGKTAVRTLSRLPFGESSVFSYGSVLEKAVDFVEIDG